MKIVVIGGTGLIGSRLVHKLREQGYEAVPASRASGVNTMTGEGLDEVLHGATVVADVSDSSSSNDDEVLRFFRTSSQNLLAAEQRAGTEHHIALSIVGLERLGQVGYMRAKVAQEKLIEQSSLPYSIVRATQFFEFLGSLANSATVGNTIHLPHVLFQPMAADDVASAMCTPIEGPPTTRMAEVAGPEQFHMDDLVRRVLRARGDPRDVITDPEAGYFGARIGERALLPGDGAGLGNIRFEDWLATDSATQPAVKSAPASTGAKH